MAKTRKYNEQVVTSCGEPNNRHTVPLTTVICYHVTHVYNVFNIVKPYQFQLLSTYSVPYSRQEKSHLITIFRRCILTNSVFKQLHFMSDLKKVYTSNTKDKLFASPRFEYQWESHFSMLVYILMLISITLKQCISVTNENSLWSGVSISIFTLHLFLLFIGWLFVCLFF